MAGFGKLAVSTFNNLDPNLDGGIWSHLIQSNFSRYQNVNFYVDYLLGAFQRFYLPSTIALICIFIPFILFVLIYLLISQYIAKRSLLQSPVNSKTTIKDDSQKRYAYKNPLAEEQLDENCILEQCDNLSNTSDTSSTNSSFSFSSHLSLLKIDEEKSEQAFTMQFFLLLLLLCLSLLFVAMSVGVQQFVLQDVSSNQSTSIQGTLISTVVNVNHFLNEVDQQSLSLLRRAGSFLLQQITSLVFKAVSSLVEQLFTQLNINALFSIATQLTENLYNIIDTMNKIKSNLIPLIQGMAVYESNLNITRDEFIKRLPNMCPPLGSAVGTGNALFQQCLSIQRTFSKIVVNIRAEKLNFDSVVTVLFSLTQYNLNVTALKDEVSSSKRMTNDLLDQAYDSLIGGLNIPSINDSINDLLTSLHDSLLNIQESLLNVTESDTVHSIIQYSTVIFVFIVLIPLVLFIVYILICCLAFLMVESAFYRYPHWCPRFFTALTNQSSPRKLTTNQLKQLSSGVRAQYFSHKIYVSLSIAVVIFLVLPTIAMIIMFVAGGVVHNKICKQVTSQGPLQVIDDALQVFFNSSWSSILQDLLSQVNIPSDILTNLYLNSPNQLFIPIYQNCSSNNGSLLPALGYSKLVNIPGILNSSFFKNFTEIGRKTAKDELAKVDIKTLLPSNLDTVLKSSNDLVKTFIDNINHNSTITELQKPFLINTDTGDAVNGTLYFLTLNQFVIDYLKIFPSSSDAIRLSSRSETMAVTEAPVYLDINNRLANTLIWFKILQNNRNVSFQIVQMIDSLNLVNETFTNRTSLIPIVDIVYDPVINSLKSDAIQIFGQLQDDLIQNLFQCNYISMTFSTLTSSACGNIIVNMGGLAMQLIITILLFLLLCTAVSVHLYTRYRLKYSQMSDC